MAYRPSEGRNQKKATPPIQPSLVPIMNLFLAIMPFLLMMVVITEVAMVSLNFSAAGGAGGGDGNKGGGNGESQEIKVVIMNSSGVEMFPGFDIKDADGTKTALRNTDNKDAFNFNALNKKLSEMKKTSSTVSDITLVVYPDVRYGTLIQTIDLCKQNGFPNVIYKSAGVSYGSGG